MADNNVFRYAREYRRVAVADHEVLLSFTSDEDAYEFNDWMMDEGERLFLAYLQRATDPTEAPDAD